MSKTTTATTSVKATSAEAIQTPVAATKASKANAIFAEMYKQSPVPARKDMLARVQAEAALTVAGSATYLQKFKDKNGLSVKKAPTAVKA